ncbi:MAG: oligosaccharide flippase family protein [Candidatus Latescibacterota bacterium]|nr:MAG: oligosaccharide flippase family protein [Candidatus Latescibacterota bacterium]
MARTLSYQAAILTLGRVLAFLALFFVPIVNVRTLSKDDFGLYRQFWLLFDTVSVFLILGVPQSLLYYFPRAEDRREKAIYLTQTLVFLVLMGLVSWLVYGVLFVVLGPGLGDAVRQYLWAFCLFTLFMMVSRTMERLFIAEKQAERQAAFIAGAYGLQALTVISVSWFTKRIDLILWALVAYALSRLLVTLFYCIPVYKPSLRDCSFKTIKEQCSYAIPLGLATIVLLVFAQTDKYVIIHFLGREVFAVYSIGAFQLPFMDIIRTSIMNVVFPLMAEHQKEGRYAEILTLWQRATLKTAVVFFPIFVFLEVSARPFITILFTEDYADAVPIFMIYLLIFLRSALDTTSVLMVYKKTGFMFKVNLVAFVCHVAFSVFMFKTIGWLGVPIATATVYYVQNSVNLLKAGQLLDTSVFRLMPWGKLVIRFVTAATLGGALHFAYRVYPVATFVELALAAVFYFAVYLGVCLALRFIYISEIKAIFGRTDA